MFPLAFLHVPHMEFGEFYSTFYEDCAGTQLVSRFLKL